MKKKIILIIILLLIITGCTNVKYLGKRLNEEEKVINNEKINYLENLFKNVEVEFTGRRQGSRNCECTGGSIDGSCIEEVCEIVKDKFVWEYNICSTTEDNFCTSASYDDVEEEWYINTKEDFKYINEVLEILENNNIIYETFTSTGNTQYFVMIKKEQNISNLVKALELVKEYYITNYNEDLTTNSIEIVIFNEDDYNYISKRTTKKSNVMGNYTLYKILTGNEFNYNFFEQKDINNDMFSCTSKDYKHISYEVFTSDGKIELWCTGLN